jgi:hypothetical protein
LAAIDLSISGDDSVGTNYCTGGYDDRKPALFLRLADPRGNNLWIVAQRTLPITRKRTYDHYGIQAGPSLPRCKAAEYQAQIGEGKPLLPVFVAQTAKVLNHDRDAYLRFGPYWWAVKRVLRDNSIGVGAYDEPIWANEYACETPELTLIAAWEFADDPTGAWGVQAREYDLDGGLAFILYDPDQAESR